MIKKKRIRGRYSSKPEEKKAAAEAKLKTVMSAHESCLKWRDEEIKRLRRMQEMLMQSLAVMLRDMPGKKVELSYQDIDSEKAEHLVAAPHEKTIEYIYMSE